MKHSTGKPTKAEAERLERMMRLGCVCCAYIQIMNPATECHHLLSGNVRMGHWYTIPICIGHHRGIWSKTMCDAIPKRLRVSIADGRKAFTRIYPSERELWEKVQDRLHEPKSWPESKRVKRVGVLR